jgi:hypothetical protein
MKGQGCSALYKTLLTLGTLVVLAVLVGTPACSGPDLPGGGLDPGNFGPHNDANGPDTGTDPNDTGTGSDPDNGDINDEPNAPDTTDEPNEPVETTPTFGEYGCDQTGASSLYYEKKVAWGDLHSHTVLSNDAADPAKNGCNVTPFDAITYADATEGLDFVAITDHAEQDMPGFYSNQDWADYLVAIDQYETLPIIETVTEVSARPAGVRSGMVVFPAWEYTKTGASIPDHANGGTRPPFGSGHKNIICYDRATVPWRGAGYDELTEPIYDYDGVTELYAIGTSFPKPADLVTYLDATGNHASGNYMLIPHHPAKAEDFENPAIDVRTDWAFVDAERQPVVEIYSRHGTSEMSGQDDDVEHVNVFDQRYSVEAALDMWFDAQDAGYKLGVVGGTDTHDGNPGAVDEYATKDDGTPANVDLRLGTEDGGMFTGGLTAVWVGDNHNRDDIWNGVWAKDCYATSGARIGVEFTAKLGDDLVAMGGTLNHAATPAASAPVEVKLHVRAVAEDGATIERIQIFQSDSDGMKSVMDSNDPAALPTFAAGSAVHVDTTAAVTATYTYFRVKVWQNKPEGNALTDYKNCAFERAWSSPIWVEP